LSKRWGVELFAKLENFQVTGSFKARGAMHKLHSLAPEARGRGVVTASSGNHGQAVGWGSRQLGCSARVFVPRDVEPSKRAAIEAWGADCVLEGDDCVETENAARAYAQAKGLAYVPPYNDRVVIAGQGTCGLEIAEQMAQVDAVFVALGGGGLIAGIATWLRQCQPRARIIGCSPDRSPALHACMQAGKVVDVECGPTLSDATAGGVEAGAITVPLCKELLDESLLVNEQEIAAAMRTYIEAHHQLIEGSAGVALAALRRERERFAGQRVAVVICGGNIGREKLLEVLK
jgi:threonine dehydratase